MTLPSFLPSFILPSCLHCPFLPSFFHITFLSSLPLPTFLLSFILPSCLHCPFLASFIHSSLLPVFIAPSLLLSFILPCFLSSLPLPCFFHSFFLASCLHCPFLASFIHSSLLPVFIAPSLLLSFILPCFFHSFFLSVCHSHYCEGAPDEVVEDMKKQLDANPNTIQYRFRTERSSNGGCTFGTFVLVQFFRTLTLCRLTYIYFPSIPSHLTSMFHSFSIYLIKFNSFYLPSFYFTYQFFMLATFFCLLFHLIDSHSFFISLLSFYPSFLPSILPFFLSSFLPSLPLSHLLSSLFSQYIHRIMVGSTVPSHSASSGTAGSTSPVVWGHLRRIFTAVR